jgi:hypothetical protein
MLILLAATCFYMKDRRSLLIFAATTVFVLGWTLLALRTTVDTRVPMGETTSNIAVFYLRHPFRFFQVVGQTLASNDFQISSYESYLGILGWFDVPFQKRYYTYFGVMIWLIAVFSVSLKRIRAEWLQRVLLLAVSAISILFIFFALLITWSPHPAQVIAGIQGRYFLIPSIIFAYGIGGAGGLLGHLRARIATFLVFCLFVFSISASAALLIKQYYLAEFTMASEEIILGSDDSAVRPKMIASTPLGQSAPIDLKIPPLSEGEVGSVVRIGVLFGTHMRDNPGEAELLLAARNGNIYRKIFPLTDLSDNGYKYFKIPADYYSSGEIRFKSGGGVSVWEVRSNDGRVYSCLKLMTVRGQTLSVHGCP